MEGKPTRLRNIILAVGPLVADMCGYLSSSDTINNIRLEDCQRDLAATQKENELLKKQLVMKDTLLAAKDEIIAAKKEMLVLL